MKTTATTRVVGLESPKHRTQDFQLQICDKMTETEGESNDLPPCGGDGRL